MLGVKSEKELNMGGFCNSETQIAALRIDLINQYRL